MDTDPQSLAELVFAIIGVFSTLGAMTPNSSTSKFVQFVLDFVNALAMNFGNAKNADG